MFNLPFLQKNSGESEKYIFMLYLSGEKAFGFAFEEANSDNQTVLYQEHVDSFLKNAQEAIEKILGNCERDLGENVYLKKTVLVLNSLYTTDSGAIRDDFLKQIKHLLKSLDLDNLGYLNFYEAVLHHYRAQTNWQYLEESIYDFTLYSIQKGSIAKTNKIAKTSRPDESLAEVQKMLDDQAELIVCFYKKPKDNELKIKHVLVDEEFTKLFSQIYFKDKQVSVAIPTKTPIATTSELPLAPGFTDTELPTEMADLPPLPKAALKLPQFKFNFKFPKLSKPVLPIMLAAGVIFMSLSYWLFLHKATVVLSTKKENFSSEINFTISPKSSLVKPFSIKIAVKSLLNTTGEKITGEKAKGEVTVYNGLFEKQELNAGAQFEAGNNTVFVLDETISVPSATTSANIDEGVVTKAFGKKTVTVTAAEIGAEGNLDTGAKLTYASLGENDFYALANSDFGGGVKKTVAVFSNKDAQNLEKKALLTAKNKLVTDFKQTHATDDVLFTETISSVKVKKDWSAEVGDETNKVTLDYIGTVTTYFAPHDKLVQKVQQEKLKDKEFVEGTFSLAKIKLVEENDQVFAYQALVKGEVQNFIDQQALIKKIKGKPVSLAKKSLGQEHNIIDFSIQTFPIPLPLMPVLPKAINFQFSR